VIGFWTKVSLNNDFMELGFIYDSEYPATHFIQGVIIDTENVFKHLDQKYKTPTDFQQVNN